MVWKADLQIFGRIRKDLEIFVQPLLSKVMFFMNSHDLKGEKMFGFFSPQPLRHALYDQLKF